MAYVAYEDLTPARVNYRIVPKLRKYYRSDGTFDLFDISKRQMSCFKYLTTKNEAGLRVARTTGASWGEYTLFAGNYGRITNTSTLTQINLYRRDNTLYAGYSIIDILLKLNNCAGLYPYYMYEKNRADHNGGSGGIYLYNNSAGKEVLKVGGSGNRTSSYNITWSAASTVLDHKDYDYVRVRAYAVDGSKFTGVETYASMYFVHKFPSDHPLYRYYR